MGERKDSSWQEKGRDFALRDSETSPSSSDQTQETTTQPQEQPAKLEQYLIKPEKIETMKKIGAGAFGEVFKGRYVNNMIFDNYVCACLFILVFDFSCLLVFRLLM